MSLLPVMGCKIHAYVHRLGPLGREGSLLCHTCNDIGRSHPNDHYRHYVVIYDTQGNAEDILTRNPRGLDWLIDWLFTVLHSLKNFSHIWRRHHCRWRAAKFRPMLGVQGLWAGSDLYRATPAETRDLGFSGLIRGTAPFSCPFPRGLTIWFIWLGYITMHR
jgi:hypothetical protein